VLTARRLLALTASASAMAALGLAAAVPAASARTLPAGKITPPAGSASRIMSDLRHAWRITRGRGVTVAVLSTGVDPRAAGLAGKVTAGPDYVKLPRPGRVAGTLIASGIAGGAGGTLVIAPDARILSVRVVPDAGEPGAKKYDDDTFTPDVVASGIRYAVGHGAGVIYVDWVPDGSDTAGLESAVRYALSRNVLVTTPAFWGAASRTDMAYPAAIPGVIAASLVTLPAPARPPSGSVAQMATNDSVLVAAPDNTVHEMGPGFSRPYTVWSDEAAAAWIAGTAALIKSAYPRLPPALAARALAVSARYHPAGGYDVTVGFGLINPYGALTEAGRLAKLPGGPADVDPAARFGAVPPPAEAVHRSAARTAAFAAALAAGVVLLLAALWLARGGLAKGARATRGA
jgi:Subtilase family